jgi:pSer/pThr/pTyr-binding forkhead associated (FHA) protein
VPLVRCSKCGQAYDVPPSVAVRLPNSIAACHCGEWLAGSKAAVLARLLNPEQIKEVDLQPYKIDAPAAAEEVAANEAEPFASPTQPRSIRIRARGAKDSVDTIFTIHEHPLWIGRKGCHIQLAESDLSIRHCSISVRGNQLVIRDADSHMGTFLDGEEISEAVIDEGVHLLRVGSAIVSIEPTLEHGAAVEPILLDSEEVLSDSEVMEAFKTRAARAEEATQRIVLVCIDGALAGQEFEIPPNGLVVGREGHVRVPDEFLSRKHFEVVPQSDGSVHVRDLGSRNGTFLNTLPAHDTKIQSGDEIRAGLNRFRVEHRA